MDTVHLLHQFALFLYAVAALGYLHAFGNRSLPKNLFAASRGILMLATGASSLAVWYAAQPEFTRAAAPLLLAALIGIITLFCHYRFRTQTMGAFTAPLATLILLLKSFSAGAPAYSSSAPSYLVAAHVVLALAGEAFAIVAFAVSCMFLWQQRALKAKQLKQVRDSFPALDRLQGVLEMALWAGLICLTLGLVSGASVKLYSTADGFGIKILWAISVWGWYLGILLCRNIFQWPVARIARMSLTGFVLMTIMAFGLMSLGVS